MEVSNSSKLESQQILLFQDQPSSRFSKKLSFFISLTILFTLIIGSIVSVFSILKHNAESQSLSANPTKAILQVCFSFPYSYIAFHGSSTEPDSNSRPLGSPDVCINSITSLYRQNNYTNRINPSIVFHLSLQLSISQIKNLQDEPSLQGTCKKLIIKSESQVNKSLTLMGVDPNDSILRDMELVNDMRSWIENAVVDLERCLVELMKKFMLLSEVEFQIKMTKNYVENSLGILRNMDNIFNMFYPPTGSILGICFMWSSIADNLVGVTLFSIPYLVLIFMFGVLLRLFRYN